MKEIPIKCKGSRYLHYAQLKHFQGQLKQMTEENAKKLRNSILKHGWISPVFIWNKNQILDGHGRLLVLGTLLEEGYTIADIPVVDIEAKTKKEAANILLAINSHYQTITDEGLYEFLFDNELTPADLDEIVLSDLDISKFTADYFEEENQSETIEDKPKSFCNIAFVCTVEEYKILKSELGLNDNQNIYPAEVLIEKLRSKAETTGI